MNYSTFKIANKLITGKGAILALSKELETLKLANPLIITDEILIEVGTFKKVTENLNEINYVVFNGVKPEAEFVVVEAFMKQFEQDNDDCIIATGGASANEIATAVSGYSIMKHPLKSLVGTDI